jgi:16S rRNA (cytosine1407-C5)-methyltransferase
MAKTTPELYTFDWLAHSQPELFARVLAAQEETLDLSLRVNTLKSDPQPAMKKWAKVYGWQTQSVPYCPSGFWVGQPETTPSSTIEHRLGYYYIQEAASMLPPELFDFSDLEHPLILDMAASPGGKTIHLADRSRDAGFIVANDASRGRLSALRIVLQTWGVINQAVTCLPGELIGALAPGRFDAVLLDAPCSMQGLRASESHKARSITLTEVEALAERQARLLESALRAVKVGGQVVYSTCTLTPQEDEGVLAALLAQFPDCFHIVDIQQHLPQPAPGLNQFMDENFPTEVAHAARLWPHIFGTAGFFAAKLVKDGPLPDPPAEPYLRAGKNPQVKVPLPVETQGIMNYLSDLYGFDLGAQMQAQALKIVEINGQLSLLGERLDTACADLPWQSSGMSLGKALPEGWQPSHEFVSRFGDRFTRGVLTLEDTHLPAWLRGEDIRSYNTDPAQRGSVVVLRDALGRNLGRAKLLDGRLKNLLPTRLF